MPKAYKRRTHRSSTRKRRTTRNRLASIYLGVGLIFLVLVSGWLISHNHPTGNGGMYDSSYQVTGQPSVDANFINQVLASYHSPVSGKGQALYDLGVKYGVDPVYALAFFQHESRFGTTGVARFTHSLGNIRVTPGYHNYAGYRKYDTWEEGFEDWYKLITIQYVQQWNLVTVDQIIPVYAPSSDNNDVDAYIQSIKDTVDAWRSGTVTV